jgi:2-desacetyl-2-hydroxyethyl bacteriochlorophyllide A dehydrogenase
MEIKGKCIEFYAPRKARLGSHVMDTEALGANEVLVHMEYTVVSGGTERAYIMAMPNTPQSFPTRLGYCGVGRVEMMGSTVSDFSIGDRVLVYHGTHADYNIVDASRLTRVLDDTIDSREAAFVVIATMGLGGVRKLEIELGESAMVMGLGLLGMFAVQFLARSGANPVIAADPNPERRALALRLGADYALDPLAEGFRDEVMRITRGKGINGCVEVTGVSSAMMQALDCASYMGRISLLGCTRVSDCAVDYYQQVHRPGVKLIGAHNFVRPKVESYPHHWTHHDDCLAILDLISAGKISVLPMLSRVVRPEDASEIYTELCDSKEFPMGTVFDWRENK